MELKCKLQSEVRRKIIKTQIILEIKALIEKLRC